MNAPSDIRLHKSSRVLQISWADGEQVELPCELLRVFSPSAEVRGHGAGERKLQTGKKYVNITSVELVGNYAIKLVFDDGHDTGIYNWDYLKELGANAEAYWDEYLTELKVANASRLPTIPVGQWKTE